MFASFHSKGTIPSCSDMLNTCAIGVLICYTVSFSILCDIPSTPGDLFSFILLILLATTSVELKLAQNIKSESKGFYAYVRSKQNVRDKVGPLEDNAGDIITEGIVMAEELNMHFSSVFRGKILVRYLYQKQSSMDQRRKRWGS